MLKSSLLLLTPTETWFKPEKLCGKINGWWFRCETESLAELESKLSLYFYPVPPCWCLLIVSGNFPIHLLLTSCCLLSSFINNIYSTSPCAGGTRNIITLQLKNKLKQSERGSRSNRIFFILWTRNILLYPSIRIYVTVIKSISMSGF